MRQPTFGRNADLVAFTSADALVSGDTNRTSDVFMRSAGTHTTVRISISTDGTQANGPSGAPQLSDDGTKVAFISFASNLVPGDTNAVADVFVRDLIAHTTKRVSVTSTGKQANGSSGALLSDAQGRSNIMFIHNVLSISADGDRIAFVSLATNLVDNDRNGKADVFVHELTSGNTDAASVTSGGSTGDGESASPSLSADGTRIAFASTSSDLVQGTLGASSYSDVFLRNLTSGSTTQQSLASNGSPLPGKSESPWLSANGRYLAWVYFGEEKLDAEGGDVAKRDLSARTTTMTACDACQAVALSSDGNVVVFEDALGGMDSFVYIQVGSQKRRELGAGSGWLDISPDGRFTGASLSIDALDDKAAQERRFGGHTGAMVFDRATDRFAPAWLI